MKISDADLGCTVFAPDSGSLWILESYEYVPEISGCRIVISYLTRNFGDPKPRFVTGHRTTVCIDSTWYSNKIGTYCFVYKDGI